MRDYDEIVRIVLEHYPNAQAIYLFGTYGTDDEWPDSDADIAALLPPAEARRRGVLALTPCRFALEALLGRPVDLLNARLAPTVLQKEIVRTGRRLYAGDEPAAEEFEALTLSLYGKLNEEREEILRSFRETGRAYVV